MTTTKRLSAAFALAMLALAAPAQASAQAAAPAPAVVIEPIGTFDFLASFGIEARTGTIEIRAGEDGVLVGEVRLQGESDPAIVDNVVVEGNQVEILALVNGHLMVTIDLDFKDADAFSGTIAVADDAIDIDGRRRAP